MKKHTILKVLSVVILLTFVLSAVLMSGCNGKLKEDVAATQTNLEAAKADIKSANDEIAKLQTELNSLKTTVGNSATSAALNEQVEALQGQIDALKNRIAAAEAALATQTETNTALANKDSALEAQISALRTDLNTLSGKVDELSTAVAANAFADFVKATNLIRQEYIEDENGDLVWNEYSMYAFYEKVAALDAEAYFDGADDPAAIAFGREIDGYYVRLARAISEQDVYDIFAELTAYIDELPTFAERFDAELLRLEGRESTEDEINGIISLEEGQLDELTRLYGHVETTDDQEARYQAILNAREALEAAEADAREVAFDAVEDGLYSYDQETDTFTANEVLYKAEVKGNIDDIAEEYADIVEEYFTDEDKLALYGVGPEALTGYQFNVDQAAEYARLVEAKKALDKIDLDTLPGISSCPLYTLKGGIDADVAKIDAWAATWEIEKDSENYKLIVTASFAGRSGNEGYENYEGLTYNFIKAVETYATTMDGLYTEHVLGYTPKGDQTGNLAEEIRKEIETGAANVLYRRIAVEIDNLFAKANDLNTAIMGVAGYDEDLDKNFINMIDATSAEDQAKITAILMRCNYLKGVKVEINEVNAEAAARIGQVTFDDGENIRTTWAAEIEAIFDVDALRYWDAEDETKTPVEGVNYTNYQDMVEEFYGNLAVLKAEYDELTKKVQAVYDAVRDIVKAEDEAVKTLANLQKVLWADKKVSALEGVNTPNFVLNDAEEPGGTITFQKFRGMLTARVLQLVALAENAEDDELNLDIAALDEFNMNRTDEYRSVLSTVVYWIEYNLNYNIDQFFGEGAPAVVERPEGDEPVYAEDPGEFEQTPPSPDDYDEGVDDPAYNEDLGDYNAALTAHNNAVAAYEAYETAMETWGPYYDYLDAREAYIYYSMDEYLLDLFDAVKDTFQPTASNELDEDGNDVLDKNGNKILNGADGYILGIENYNYPAEGNYKFIEDFEAVIAAAEDYLTTYAAAKEEWAGILEDVAALPELGDICIHDAEIATASERYAQYADTFYAGAIENDEFDELDTFEELDGKQQELDSKIAAAELLYNDILRLAKELKDYGVVPAEDDVDEIVEKVAMLRGMMAFYRENYCDGGEACTGIIDGVEVPDQCKFIGTPIPAWAMPTWEGEIPGVNDDGYADYQEYLGELDAWNEEAAELAKYGELEAELVAYQAQAKAMIVKVVADEVYFEEIPYISTTGADYVYRIGTNPQDGITLKTIFCKMFDLKESVNGVKEAYQLFTELTIDPALANVADYPIEPVA